jgi:hypothetical protein
VRRFHPQDPQLSSSGALAGVWVGVERPGVAGAVVRQRAASWKTVRQAGSQAVSQSGQVQVSLRQVGGPTWLTRRMVMRVLPSHSLTDSPASYPATPSSNCPSHDPASTTADGNYRTIGRSSSQSTHHRTAKIHTHLLVCALHVAVR